MNKPCVILFLLWFAAGSAAAQDIEPSGDTLSDSLEARKSIYVSISTNAKDALLFADSVLIGRLPSGFVAVPPGTERLRLAVRDANTWSVPPVEKRLNAAGGDSLQIDLAFPYRYRVESIPFGAKVRIERGDRWEHLGMTPLLHTSKTPIEGRILVERPGYAPERIEAGSDVWNRHVVMLKPSDDLDPTAAQVNWQPPRQRRVWIDYAALGTAFAAGILAVHYKFKADDLFTRYEDAADPALRDEIHTHDVRSGVAFGVMQAGLGVFAIRLVLR